MSQRYFVNKLDGVIKDQDAHHIKRVMRMRDGDEIIVCANKQCILASIKIGETDVTYHEISKLDAVSHFDVTLVQGLPKKNKMDFVSKYATVYGANTIIFSGMERSISKLENKAHKLNRLETIAKEASELAHRFDIPQILMYEKLKNIDFSLYDEIIVCDEDEEQVDIKTLKPLNYQKKYIIIIGPEGGISKKERDFFKSIDAKFITLGHYILPTEVAALSALSFFMHENNK
jgi:16S rRNA (uracil1498-N3)-methyltransferase